MLTPEQMDDLKEIVSIGAGTAATALSQLVRKRIDITVPSIGLVPIDKASDIFGGLETLVTAVYLQLLGDSSGVILFSFHKEEAYKFIDLLLDQTPGKTKVINEMGQSALKEAASILSGAYIGALAKMLNMRLLVSAPALAQDMAGAIIDNILIETAKEADNMIIIDTELKIVDMKVMAYFFFIPDIASLKTIVNAIGKITNREA